MDKNQIKDSLKMLEPTDEQSARMLLKIEEAAREQEAKKQASQKQRNWYPARGLRYACSFVLVIGVLFFSGVGINAATNGKFVETIKESLRIIQTRQDVVGQATDIEERGIEVYAPEILWLDTEYIIFGTQRGVLIYDIAQECISGTIDTQAVDCVYFDSDPKNTHLVKKNNSIILFNSEDGKPYGDYYEYDMLQNEGTELKVVSVGNDKETIETHYTMWETMQKKYGDTFATFAMDAVMVEKFNGEGMYSMRCYSWEDADGVWWKSYLEVHEGEYRLVSYNAEKDVFQETVLNLQTMDSTEAELTELPPFTYSGDNMAIKAICDYIFMEQMEFAEEHIVNIPGFVIYKEVEKDGEYLVFGNFWTYGYQLNGNMLEACNGGEMPACFHLKATDDGYDVIRVDRAGDGADYMADIEAFTKDYPGLADMYSHNDESRVEGMKEYVRMYVTDNQLDVKYVKEYGWDPILIFE